MRRFWLLFALGSVITLVVLMLLPPSPVKHSLSGGKIPLAAEDSLAIKHSCDGTGQRQELHSQDSSGIYIITSIEGGGEVSERIIHVSDSTVYFDCTLDWNGCKYTQCRVNMPATNIVDTLYKYLKMSRKIIHRYKHIESEIAKMKHRMANTTPMHNYIIK